MRRTEVLQGLRPMKFEDVYGCWQERRLSQSEARCGRTSYPLAAVRAVAACASGHAIGAIVYARVLAEIFPDQKDALMELARQIGYGRVVGGVHFPMDVLAGEKLGQAYADVIVKQPAFTQAIERIRGRQPPSRGTAG